MAEEKEEVYLKHAIRVKSLSAGSSARIAAFQVSARYQLRYWMLLAFSGGRLERAKSGGAETLGP